MQIGILQLSDIHLKSDKNSFKYKVEKLHAVIQDELLAISHLFIAISGDTAFSGKSEEYALANEYLEEIKSNIKRVKNLPISVITIPGNHDCYFDEQAQTVRTVILNSIKSNNTDVIDPSIIEQLCVPQKHYFEFAHKHELENQPVITDQLFKSFSFQLENYHVIFNCFNSSWISERKEVPSTLFFPIENYESVLKKNKGDLVISMMHHPLNWYPPVNSRKIKEVLEETSDVILTGHEHVSTFTKKDNMQGQITEYIEGSVLQESNNPNKSEFNFIRINLLDRIQQLFQFSWKEKYYLQIYCSEWIKYDRSQGNEIKDFQINNDFSAYLNDPGITINHPRKTKVILSDIYIYPDSKVVQLHEKADRLTQYVNLKELIDFKKTNKYLILGSEKSGKTTYCKTLYNHLFKKGYMPVLLDGSKINKSNLNDFQQLLYKTFIDQYSKDSLELFKQLPNDLKVIIIDDLDKTKLNTKFTFEFLKNISSIYKYIVLTCDELFKFSDLMNEHENEDSFHSHYERFEIMELGFLLRTQFVEKWNCIGQLETATEAELQKNHDKATETINIIIGNNYVPAFPFFLLVILQTIESNVPHNLKESSYGYYYDLLILQSLSKINMKHEEIDAFYNCITELAYRFFHQNIIEMAEDEMKDFHKWFTVEYDLTYDFEKNITRMVEANIVEKFNGIYRFKYKYVYYYFVAKYLSNSITELAIREKISLMCSKVHIEEFANIIMFLTHLSKDPFILNELFSHAQKIFADTVPANLENDEVSALNSLVEEVPKMVYENIEVKKHREDRLKLKDDLDRSKKEVAATSKPITEDEIDEDDDSEMDFAAQMNLGFKTVEIIGQILKSYYGSIKADEKYILCEEAYMVGLRSLNYFLSTLNSDIEAFSSHLQGILEQRLTKETEKAEIEKQVRRLLFSLCCGISFQSIKRISDSMGSENLYETFKKITLSHPTTAVKLIEISIKIDQSRTIPYYELKRLKTELENNVMAYSLLRALVINHLYMFDANYKEKQQICDLLGISMKNQRSIELLSPLK
ncbi:metallophosphoesterase [Paenibacillus sp. GP183]|uniref:STAND family AAA ATPase n=1 Tax=Paenibacillus sp. GP183 TaxID=1882751 RepID=UPI000894679E|nr:metallophosphoesterase [Paenibacillus sp. GP183]SEB94009.1 Calcineurin-like phosphoesterase [Paenibacillus sp. GP183]